VACLKIAADAELEECDARLDHRRRDVIRINSPHNPTGTVLRAEEVASIWKLCTERDLSVISDEVYETLAFSARHVSPWSFPDMSERTIVISSLSKSHAAPGIRFRWVIGPPELTNHMANLILCMFYGASRSSNEPLSLHSLTTQP
jgi:arginine:pyruvate transaminase